MSLLEQSLLCKFAGSLPAVAVIASFFSFSRNAVKMQSLFTFLLELCFSLLCSWCLICTQMFIVY